MFVGLQMLKVTALNAPNIQNAPIAKKLVNLGASNSVIVASQVKNRHPGTVSYHFAPRRANPCLYLNVKVFGKLLRALLDIVCFPNYTRQERTLGSGEVSYTCKHCS